uniref:Mpv17-like protein 2 n=1 Tax=Strigamia maritima TaxID=126957 RepID=T1J531_STRMM
MADTMNIKFNDDVIRKSWASFNIYQSHCGVLVSPRPTKSAGNYEFQKHHDNDNFTLASTFNHQKHEESEQTTNIGISVSLSGTGDILQQHYDIIRQKTNSWDRNRTRNMSLSGATVGAVCHFWYLWLDKKLPGRTFKIVLKKVFFSPVIISFFFITMGMLEGSTIATVKQEIIQKGTQFYLAEWMIWPPAQIFNFYVLPTRFRVLYDNVISLGFDVYMSYLKNTFSKLTINKKEIKQHLSFFSNLQLNFTKKKSFKHRRAVEINISKA